MKAKQPSQLKDGAECTVIGGTHKGKFGTVRDVNTSKTGHLTITVVQPNGERFKTLAKNVVVARKSAKSSKPAVSKPTKLATARDKASAKLPKSMVTGKASSAKAADGDKPVFDYIASLPQPQRSIAEYIDALAAKTLPGLQRSVKWGMSYYGVGDGWCFCCGGFAGHVKLMFINGASLVPVPPVTPLAMGKSTRGVELESMDDIDKRRIAAWMKQVAAVPGVGGKKK